MRRIFVTHDPGDLDFSKAQKFGRLVFMTQGRVSIYNPSRIVTSMFASLPDDYDPENDLLLIAGNILTAFGLGIVIGDSPFESVSLLVYDAKERDYIERKLTLLPLSIEPQPPEV